MRAALALPEQRTLLQNVSWDTYERLLTDHLDASTPHFNFDQGVLEITSASSEHEECKQALTLLVEILADELGMDIRNLGSTTFRRSDLERGFEADACFYVQSAGMIEGKAHIDPAVDPVPDLVIEIEITSPALNKLPIYAAFKVVEVWRWDGERLIILRLQDRQPTGALYTESQASGVFPNTHAKDLSRLVEQGLSSRRTEWLREVRRWVRGLR
jgi:Uma2 family endonuclease